MTDFESGCISAFEETFPDALTSTCYFHLMQSFRRNADKAKLDTGNGINTSLTSIIRADGNLGFDFRKLR